MTIKKLISVKKIKTFFGDGYGFFTIPIFMVFFAILMSWVTEISDYKEERKSAVSSVTNAQINVIKLVNHSLSQVLEHGVTVSHIAQQFLAKPTPDLRNVLINLLKEGQGFTAIALYDTHGKLVNTLSHKAKTFIFPGKLNSAGNESFSNKQPGVSFFSWVSRDRSVLVFPLFDTNRQPLGMMLANLDLNYALNQYKDIAIGDTGNIQIFSNDGIEVTALHPDKSNSFKASANLFKVIPAATATGTLEKQTARGENIRLISYIKNSASPFVVTISQDKDEILKSAKSRHNRYMIAVLITALFTALSLLWMLRVTKRRHQLYRKLLVSEKAKSSLLNALEDEKEKAYALATHDHVTHLPNRQLFMELAVSHLARAKRSRHHYAAMFIDLDRFKPINDSLGHHIGDMVLQEIALRLKNCLRESDIVSRFGSDEFVVMLAGVGAVEHIRKIAEKIIHSIEQPFNNLEGNDVQLSSTIGISVYPRDGINVSLLIKAAEDAMHRSKRAGQGRYVFFDQTNQTNSRLSFELDQGFYKAIQNNEFLLHYQPKVRSTDFAITGVEALIRWQHPQHGLIFPGDFIPILESSDKIVDLGDWVINEACRQLSEWKTANKRVVPIAINVSTKQLLDKEFVTRLTRTLQKYALDAEDIEIEVTESCFMNDTAVSVATLNAISAMGIHVSLDDFGTGFSSLGYIKALPVSEIKIDRSFIRDIRSDQSDKVIVSSTIELAHNLGLTVVAEGVETLDQITYLRAAGCDVVQGYYFSRPVSAELIREILDSGSIEQSQWLLNKFSGHQASLAL